MPRTPASTGSRSASRTTTRPARTTCSASSSRPGRASSLPLMIYSTWWEGGLDIDGALLRRLADLPHVEAVKWSAPTADRFTEGLAAIADRLVVIDNQGLHVWGHILGANGFVTHLSNFWPEYPLSIWRALEARDYEAVPAILGRFKWAWSDWAGRVARDQRRRGSVHQGGDGARRVPGRAAAAAGRSTDAGADGRARRALRSRGAAPAGRVRPPRSPPDVAMPPQSAWRLALELAPGSLGEGRLEGRPRRGRSGAAPTCASTPSSCSRSTSSRAATAIRRRTA